MNDQDLLAQFKRDHSLLCGTAYYSRISESVTVLLDPLLGHVATLYWCSLMTPSLTTSFGETNDHHQAERAQARRG
jgi:hypothetical protein